MTCPADGKKHSFSLSYLKSFKIKNKKQGLTEPSGLALSRGGNALWTISDDTKKIFKLRLNGRLKKHHSFKVPHNELEGITLDPSGNHLIVVKESTNEIIKIALDSQQVIKRKRLSTMAGYDTIAQYFNNNVINKGLEGITWNNKSESFFLTKEDSPGLLVEVSHDLKTILGHCLLNADNGFIAPNMDSKDIDFSDICYDRSRDCFWIISDQARRLFLYNGKTNTVLHSVALAYKKKGRYKEIKKPEGITVDPESNRLYIVSDETAILYIFDIR